MNKILSNYADRIKELTEELNHYISEYNKLIAQQKKRKNEEHN